MSKFTSINHDINEFYDFVDDLYESLADDEFSKSMSILSLMINKCKTVTVLIKKNI